MRVNRDLERRVEHLTQELEEVTNERQILQERFSQ